MKCPSGCGEMFRGEVLWVCGWCGTGVHRREPDPPPLPSVVSIPAGKFAMGAAVGDLWAQDHERPAREVYLSPYAIGLTPITNGEYRAFVEAVGWRMPNHWAQRPPVGENARHPICFVAWQDARAYCDWLSSLTGKTVTLPTEAQWEKAARGGFWLDGDEYASRPNPNPNRIFPNGETILLPEQANFAGLQAGTTPVGHFPTGASPYGCLDMSGNVSEWCQDSYGKDSYSVLPDRDPCANGGGRRTLRGGSWRSGIEHVRCSNRYLYDPDLCSYGIGFRVTITDSTGR